MNLKETDLSECILESIKAHVANVASLEEIIACGDTRRIINALAKQYKEQIAENKKQLEQIGKFKSSLYENMISSVISKEDYKSYKAQYVADEQRLREAIATLKTQLEDVLAGKSERLRWLEHFKRFGNLAVLDRRTVVNLIHSIHVKSKTELTITYHYQNECKNALALLGMEVA